MPFLMLRNDITKVTADAIVNPANRNLLQGSGTSRAIYQAAGEQELTAACEAIGHCDLGRAVCTPAFGLPAKYIFHAVCPAWHGGFFGEAKQLAGVRTVRTGRNIIFVEFRPADTGYRDGRFPLLPAPAWRAQRGCADGGTLPAAPLYSGTAYPR